MSGQQPPAITGLIAIVYKSRAFALVCAIVLFTLWRDASADLSVLTCQCLCTRIVHSLYSLHYSFSGLVFWQSLTNPLTIYAIFTGNSSLQQPNSYFLVCLEQCMSICFETTTVLIQNTSYLRLVQITKCIAMNYCER